MSIKFSNTKNGLTMIEMLFSIMCFGFIMGTCFLLLKVGWDSWQISSAQNQLSQNLSQSVSWLVSDLKQSGPSAIVDVPADDQHYNAIQLTKAVNVSSDTVQWGSVVSYALGGSDGHQLIRTQDDVARPVATNITSIQFSRASSAPNVMQITLTSVLPTYRADQELTTTLNVKVALRN